PGILTDSALTSGLRWKLLAPAVRTADRTRTVHRNICRRDRERTLRALSMTPVQLRLIALPIQAHRRRIAAIVKSQALRRETPAVPESRMLASRPPTTASAAKLPSLMGEAFFFDM